MDLRLALAILIGKFIAILNKLTGSGATAAPGLYALKIDPNLVKKISKNVIHGSIIVSGTNGKTTTSRLIADILSSKYKIIHNRQGSNLMRGIASTFISHSSIVGKVDCDLAIWEVDEATLPKAIKHTSPKIIVLLNLFRDQLDRYGEVDTVRVKWQKALSFLPKSTTLILNADDPGISILAESFKGKVIHFGVDDKEINLPQIENVADIRHCLNCGSNLVYSTLLSAHMGHYSCPNCYFKRPIPQISAESLNFKPNFSTSIKLNVNDQLLNMAYQLPGLYNVYNVLAAVAVATPLNFDPQTIKYHTEKFSAAFGRFQQIKIDGKNILIFLIKNPTGANEIIRTLALKNNFIILAILNDKIADGRDVSWIWDTNWEILTQKVKKASISGIRAWDLATRLKYADFKLSKNNIYKDIYYSIKRTLGNLNTKDTLIILPTYTALLEVQKSLRKLGANTKWYEQ